MATNLIKVHNPYPEWQSMAGDMNCWNCFKLLWHRADTLKHLCYDCQQTHVAVESQAESETDFDYNSAPHPSAHYRIDDDNPFDGVEPGLGRID